MIIQATRYILPHAINIGRYRLAFPCKIRPVNSANRIVAKEPAPQTLAEDNLALAA